MLTSFMIQVKYFNSRSRAGSDMTGKHFNFYQSYFNSRSRAGSDHRENIFQNFLYFISIHAPVRGATVDISTNFTSKDISIHAPVRGATEEEKFELYYWTISIHAPVRGATNTLFGLFMETKFQFTLPCGERQCDG